MQYNAIDRHEETAQAMMGAFRRENTARGAWITSRVFLTALRMAARLMMAQNAATQASAVSSMASSLAEARNEVIRASDGAARDEDDGCIGRARILSWWGNSARFVDGLQSCRRSRTTQLCVCIHHSKNDARWGWTTKNVHHDDVAWSQSARLFQDDAAEQPGAASRATS